MSEVQTPQAAPSNKGPKDILTALKKVCSNIKHIEINYLNDNSKNEILFIYRNSKCNTIWLAYVQFFFVVSVQSHMRVL